MTAIVLASQSTVRGRLLAAAGVAVTVDPAAIDEAPLKRVYRSDLRRADECALALAAAKAKIVAVRHPSAITIGADQILEHAGEWFDKPRDRAEARAHLQALRGRAHELVCAAVAVRGAVVWQHVERAHLTMRDFSDAFLEDYLDAMGDDACAQVGVYALEGLGAQLFARVEGDYFSILGLPLLPLLAYLRDAGALQQ